jgi:hypothetical protein
MNTKTRTLISEKHVVAVQREFEDDGFLITAFMTSDAPIRIVAEGQ